MRHTDILTGLLTSIKKEQVYASLKYGRYTSTHEAYGVIAEEVAELLDAIRANDLDAVRTEARQVAAVAYKLMCDLGDDDFRKRSGF